MQYRNRYSTYIPRLLSCKPSQITVVTCYSPKRSYNDSSSPSHSTRPPSLAPAQSEHSPASTFSSRPASVSSATCRRNFHAFLREFLTPPPPQLCTQCRRPLDNDNLDTGDRDHKASDTADNDRRPTPVSVTPVAPLVAIRRTSEKAPSVIRRQPKARRPIPPLFVAQTGNSRSFGPNLADVQDPRHRSESRTRHATSQSRFSPDSSPTAETSRTHSVWTTSATVRSSTPTRKEQEVEEDLHPLHSIELEPTPSSHRSRFTKMWFDMRTKNGHRVNWITRCLSTDQHGSNIFTLLKLLRP